ncbi:uncharacterized protein LOC119434712, partial [Dermacentor silvarum]|uniref:uncharacterized protein LOC119434712 n=1 Tax=Dermacentor silvarum TaxID=543639 RepID=UPI001896C747
MEASTSRMNTYACNRCHQRTHSLSALFRHFCTWHGIEDNWKCGLEGCEKAFRLYSSFRKHVSRHHNHLFLQTTTADTSLAPFADNLEETVQTYPTQPADQAAEQACFDVDILNTSGQCVDRGTPGSSDQCATALSSLLLKWQEGRQLPQSTLNEVANDMINFISEFRADFNATTITKLEQLRTKTGRENWWKSSHTFVSPRTVCLSDQGTSDSFEYIPILETLKAVSSVYDTFQTTHKPCSALLQDVSDGMYFKEHCLFKNASSQKLFALQLYFDEFEICNPIGSKRGKHKLLAGYLTILNLPPRFRSKVDSKHLVLLVKNSTVARFTLHKIVQPLLEDIQYLESQGVEISGEFIKGSLLYVCGDNLSSHQIGGFRECFSSGPICRFCLAKKEHISEKWNEEEFIIRTKKMHAQHIHLLKTDSSLSNVYGISGESCLSSLQSFDVTKGLPPDVMHDLFEGVIPFAMKHILRHIMSCRVLTLDELNDRLVSFPLQGGDKKSRLPPLSHHSVFGTSAIK